MANLKKKIIYIPANKSSMSDWCALEVSHCSVPLVPLTHQELERTSVTTLKKMM